MTYYMKYLLAALGLLLATLPLAAQKDFYRSYPFSQADTLRGQLRPERTCFDVTYYELNIRVDVAKQYIRGYADIYFEVLTSTRTLQLDLYENMDITEITWHDQSVEYRRVHDAVFVDLPDELEPGHSSFLRVMYEGAPALAKRPPWDGGFVFTNDTDGNPWVAVACQGDGASLWWPCKDHLSDEPDSMLINVTVPAGLTCISNGNLRKTSRVSEDYNLFSWFVSYPINTYNATLNIGKYEHFSDVYLAGDGDSLVLDFYVLPKNLAKAKKHFAQVHDVLRCYEYYFGKYPFWNDGYALVETPYLGMEHQGCIAYGNKYKRGYLGGMIPRDMDWDYIIVHESGHEYFGNGVSVNDNAELWIHEGFTTYMEALFVECQYGYADAIRYLVSQRPYILNREPLLGPRDVNFFRWLSSDHYYKGAWVLHTLRHVISDEVFFPLLRNFIETYKYKTCTTADFVRMVNEVSGRDLSPFFEQYLQYPDYPTLLYQIEQQDTGLLVRYRWDASVPDFEMPVLVGEKGNYTRIEAVAREVREVVIPGLKEEDFSVATELFYIRQAATQF